MKHAQGWLGSVSDMMSGLMMLFLFIAVAYMLAAQRDQLRAEEEKAAAEIAKQQAEAEKSKAESQATLYLHQGETIRQIAATYSELQTRLYTDLLAEFKDDLPRWNATLEQDSTIRFNEPEVLFETGKSALRDKFKAVLDDFFPRYVRILTGERYQRNIQEVRVEGHTSTEWQQAASLNDRYLSNARLSQERALAVVQYAFLLEAVSAEREWLIATLRANGLSFAVPIRDALGDEDKDRSRRVEFRVFTRTKEQILRIIEVAEQQSRPDVAR